MRGRSLPRPAIAAATVALIGAAAPARAQDVPARVDAIETGAVQMTVAARPGVCGDGERVLAYRDVLIVWPTMFGRRGMEDSWSCSPGPLRITLRRRNGRTTSIETVAGRRGRAAADGVTELGEVDAEAAQRYFAAEAARLEGDAARDALTPVALAGGTDPVPLLLGVARADDAEREARARALFWAAVLGDEETAQELAAIASSESIDRRVREAALAALADMREGLGVAELIPLARRAPEAWLRERSIFWLGDAEHPDARAALHALAREPDLPRDELASVIFALGEDDAPENLAVLTSLHTAARNRGLVDRLMHAVSEHESAEGTHWLLERAKDEREPIEIRKQALFWAAESEVPLDRIVAVYRAGGPRELRRHALFVISEYEADAATDALIEIVRNERDPDLRRQALFWLGERDDPRAAAFLLEILREGGR